MTSSNNHTPKSVLEAPVSRPIPISAQPGKNRLSRRHIHVAPTGKVSFVPKGQQEPATNVPFEKDGV
jgi:hypothetical protein